MPLLAGEAAVIASNLTSGNRFVRAETTHFSTEDDNYAWVCNGTCSGSDGKVPGSCPGGCKETGSIIDVQNQTVSEAVAIPGTGLVAYLHSHRQPRPSFAIDVPLRTGADGGVKGASSGRVVLEVGGRQVTVDAPDAGEGEVVRVSWDGKDAFGRTVRGPVQVSPNARERAPRRVLRAPRRPDARPAAVVERTLRGLVRSAAVVERTLRGVSAIRALRIEHYMACDLL